MTSEVDIDLEGQSIDFREVYILDFWPPPKIKRRDWSNIICLCDNVRYSYNTLLEIMSSHQEVTSHFVFDHYKYYRNLLSHLIKLAKAYDSKPRIHIDDKNKARNSIERGSMEERSRLSFANCWDAGSIRWREGRGQWCNQNYPYGFMILLKLKFKVATRIYDTYLALLLHIELYTFSGIF